MLAWVKHTITVSWEPVIVVSARAHDPGLRDWIQCEPDSYQWREKPVSYVIGQKPEPFYLKAGDVMTLGIEKLGQQRQDVIAWSKEAVS